MNEAFKRGFIKAAKKNGLSEAITLGLLKKADSSFLGRYLASGLLEDAQFENNPHILSKIDPDGDILRNRFMYRLNKDERHKSRQIAAPLATNIMNRSAKQTMKADLINGGTTGAALGALFGFRPAITEALTPGSTDADSRKVLLGLGLGGAAVGGLLGAGTQGLLNKFEKYRAKKITQEDIQRVIDRKKNNSMLKQVLPFSDVYDAATG